jgi:3'(2'), 5'-bisphosphate nucleotidase
LPERAETGSPNLGEVRAFMGGNRLTGIEIPHARQGPLCAYHPRAANAADRKTVHGSIHGTTDVTNKRLAPDSPFELFAPWNDGDASMSGRDGEARELLDRLSVLAEKAGEEILRYYQEPIAVIQKADASPVTAADQAAEALILETLVSLLPDVPVISEEASAAGHTPKIGGEGTPDRRFWLVDPLDGTKEFLSHNGEFTVNIALIQGTRPVLGVVHLPALGTTYTGSVPASGGPGSAMLAHRGNRPRPIACRRQPPDGAIVLASRSHSDAAALEAFLSNEQVATLENAGSSLKFCRIAEGLADIYPRLGRTMEWDTAAGQAVLVAAGGSVRTLDGKELSYGKPGFENPHFVARGRDA